MTDDDHSRISMLAARLESGANQLAAYAGAFDPPAELTSAQTGDTKSNGRLEADRREQDVSDHQIVFYRNQRDTVGRPAKALYNPRLYL